MKCERCNKETNTFITSMFNTETICMECKEKEKAHPKYKEALEADRREILNENYNFGGIGKPSDL